MTINDVRNDIKKFYGQLKSIKVNEHDYREFYGACDELLQIDSYLVSMEESEQIPDPQELKKTYQKVKEITNVFISTDKDGC